MDDSYYSTPFLENQMEPLEWLHHLSTIDASTLNHGIKLHDNSNNENDSSDP